MTDAKKEDKLERIYNVPLRSGYVNSAGHKRTKRSIRILKDFLKKHMKVEEVKLGQNLNKKIWERGIKNPPHHVKVTVTKEDNVAMAELVGFDYAEEKRPEKKVEEQSSLKDKLAAKLGIKDEPEEKPKKETPKGVEPASKASAPEKEESKVEEKPKPEAATKPAPSAEEKPKPLTKTEEIKK